VHRGFGRLLMSRTRGAAPNSLKEGEGKEENVGVN